LRAIVQMLRIARRAALRPLAVYRRKTNVNRGNLDFNSHKLQTRNI